jgi:hypothetical protein
MQLNHCSLTFTAWEIFTEIFLWLFLLLLEIDYQKILSLGVVLKIRSDQTQGLMHQQSQQYLSPLLYD